MNRTKITESPKNFYQLKANLTDIQLENGSKRLVLVFEKKSDPEYSAERIRELEGFVICSIRRPTQ